MLKIWSARLPDLLLGTALPQRASAAIERETVEAARHFGTIKCSAAPDNEHDPLALFAGRRIEVEIVPIREQLAITYRSRCITGRLVVISDVRGIDDPR